jgi:hypothetical protein
MTSEMPRLMRSSHSGQRMSASQVNAQWGVSEPTGRPSGDNREELQVGRVCEVRLTSHDDLQTQSCCPTSLIDTDKTESLLKLLRTDHFAGLVNMRYHAESMGLPSAENGSDCNKETKSSCIEY